MEFDSIYVVRNAQAYIWPIIDVKSRLFTLNGKIISDDTMTPRLVKKVLGACPIYNN